MPRLLAAQTWQWAEAPAPSAIPGLSLTALDAAGNLVVAGRFAGTLILGSDTLRTPGDRDVFVARRSPSGQWLRAYQAGGPGHEAPAGLALDAAGNIIIAGTFSNASSTTFGPFTLPNAGQPNTPDLFVARLSPAGQWTQAVRAGGSGAETIAGLALDASGNAVVAGSFGLDNSPAVFGSFSLASNGAEDVFVARLNAAGQWTQAVSGGGSGSKVVRGLHVDAAGTATVLGAFNSPSIAFGAITLTSLPPLSGFSFQYDVFVARLNAAGQWTQAVRGGGSGSESPLALAVDAGGTATVAGSYQAPSSTFGATTLTTTGLADVFVARLSPAGVWTQAAGGGSTNDDNALAVAVDGNGNAFVAGSFRGPTASFGPATLPNAAPNTDDLFVARLNAAGQWTQAVGAGGPGVEYGFKVQLLPGGDLLLAGDYTGAAVFGSTTLPMPGMFSAGFLARLSGQALPARSGQPALGLAPNPAHTTAHLTLAAATTPRTLLLLDAYGRTVRQQPVAAGATSATLGVQGLAPGFYLVRCGDANSRLLVE
ncbi:hypothetical protein LJ737_24875 [Hymenobacter sp. 15J16-1T3B]|uniref:hypothetical protein n=1 Tax=Hymenobacter sp. 15J16-1T3B TaxID=2886941 RepID=UPI001D104964|nr:hypothetical protein [Hymenobacter sp. 15J16-1T3B]MCC3160495.1 hypothetical protein [Hymenobacter sp. 15J16-1T3B]